MMPLLPAIIGCGLVSSLVSILTLTDLVQSGDETYQILNGLGQVAMFFMPVLTSFVACFLITRFWPGFDPDAK
jgi:PTS system beta-glucosides-specific IIC component